MAGLGLGFCEAGFGEPGDVVRSDDMLRAALSPSAFGDLVRIACSKACFWSDARRFMADGRAFRWVVLKRRPEGGGKSSPKLSPDRLIRVLEND
jgi:hypothetical protein